jgi:hypothetical protein
MAIYLVVPLAQNSSRLGSSVTKHISEQDRYPMPNDAGWFVNYAGTSIELSNLLEITGQQPGQPTPIGSTIITPITTYYGRGASDMWEWLKTRMESGR